jgi:multidrug efflux pump
MKFTEYFIKHKVVSIILNVMILVIGLLALRNITVREYPDVKIPILSVNTIYPNANQQLIESSVTNIIEDAAAGIPGIRSITSQSSAGNSYVTLSFEEGANLDNALIDLKDAIGQAKSELPEGLKEPIIQKGNFGGSFPFFLISITSNEMNFEELTHYVTHYLKNNFRSIKGVGKTDVSGRPYTMKVTLDPKKMYNYGINVSDVVDALKKYNISLPVGKFRDSIPTTMDMRLISPIDFENTHIATKNGRSVYLNNIADVDLTVDTTQNRTRVNGKTGVVIALERSIDANPIEVASALRQEVENLRQLLPEHIKINIDIDQSIFIQSSLKNIYSSIMEAVILVLIIVFIFLGNARATLIPLITIPISLIGSMAIMLAFGMSINTLTLLAMVMSIGLVVDDAIVVLENISRHIEDGMTPMAAAIKGTSEIGFAIVAMTFTLASVYIPIAFIHGIIGQLFIEFAITLAGGVILSGIVALTLSPMMCSVILKNHAHTKETKINRLLSKLDTIYAELLKSSLSKPKLVIGIIIASILISSLVARYSAQEIVPKEDRGVVGIYIPPQPGKNMDDVEAYAAKIEKIAATIPEKQNYLTFMGPWGVNTCIILVDNDNRSRHQTKILESIEPAAKAIPSIDAWPWAWEIALPGVEAFGSSDLTFVITTTDSYEKLSEYADKMVQAITATGKFIYVKHNVKFDTAGYDIVVDKHKLANLQIQPYVISQTVGAFFSGNQDLNFSKDDILYPVSIISKTTPWSLNEIYVIDSNNNKIAVGSFASMKENVYIAQLPHYNQMRSATITGMLIPIYSIESLMPIISNIAAEILPKSCRIQWTGVADLANRASGTMILLFTMAIIFVYSILAIQFNNFYDPITIMTTVPLACAGALLTGWLFGGTINIYSQIGLITLVGLITKHGILIVEFANRLVDEGEDIINAVSHAAILRLRPILMTTGAMILGALPLVFGSGAGSEARSAIGIILVGGLAFGTIFTLFVLPKIYCWVKKLSQ